MKGKACHTPGKGFIVLHLYYVTCGTFPCLPDDCVVYVQVFQYFILNNLLLEINPGIELVTLVMVMTVVYVL